MDKELRVEKSILIWRDGLTTVVRDSHGHGNHLADRPFANVCRMKKLLLVIISALLVCCSLSVVAVVITPDVEFVVGNKTYTVNATMVFSQIIIDSTYIIFNNTGFYVTSPNSLTVTLVFISNNIGGASDGVRVLDFYGDTASGTVWFNISGFPPGNNYTIKRSGVTITTCTANASGYIHFSSNVWGTTKRLQIYQLGAGGGDTTPPVISSVNVVSSNPVDTLAGHGWENFSCTATDNVGVATVQLHLTNPDQSTTDVTMAKKTGSTTYYSNRSLHTQGNYSYNIQATDTSNNNAFSSSYAYSLPPNWDVNNDGRVTILDLVFVSNHYSESGSNGWIREDVDNNGVIQVLDIVMVSDHFSEVWWV